MDAITIRQAQPSDAETVSSILQEAADWMADVSASLWHVDDLKPDSLAGEIAAGLYWLAFAGDEPAGCVRYQLEDALIWPNAPLGEAAYIHRLAVRRSFAGGAVSTALIDWAKAHARDRGHAFLRLDCDVGREKLRALYERHGFVEAGEKIVGPHAVMRYECALEDPAAD